MKHRARKTDLKTGDIVLKTGDIVFWKHNKGQFFLLIEDLNIKEKHNKTFKIFSSYDGKLSRSIFSLSRLEYISVGIWKFKLNMI